MADNDPAPDPGTPPKAEPLAERVGAIEAEQQRQGGILERIEQALAGSPKASGGTPPSASGVTEPPPAGPSIAEQVRKGVEEIEARKAKEAADKEAADKEAAWRASVDERLPERKPSEPATGRKQKMQERIFGKADAR